MKRYSFPKNQKDFFTHNNHFNYPEMHTHTYWEIHIFTSGTATHLINGQAIKIEPNTLWIIHPTDIHCITEGSPDFSYINFGIQPKTMETFILSKSELFKQALLQPLWHFSITPQSTKKIISNEIKLLELDKSSFEYEFELYKQFLTIIHRISEHIHIDSILSQQLDSDIAKIIDLLKDTKNMTRSLTDIFNEVNFSYSGISKKFKRQINMSPSAFFIKQKMQAAKTLLESSHDSIEKIATTVGYDSITCFYNTFKAHFGITPSAYRKNWFKEYNEFEEI